MLERRVGKAWTVLVDARVGWARQSMLDAVDSGGVGRCDGLYDGNNAAQYIRLCGVQTTHGGKDCELGERVWGGTGKYGVLESVRKGGGGGGVRRRQDRSGGS